MFKSKFLSNLQQPLGDNPWLANSTNRIFRIRFHRQCDYLLRFNAPKKKKNSILKKNWLRNDANANANEDDDPYEAPIFVYNRVMDQLVEVNIISNEVEEEDCKTCPNGGMMELDDEK